MYSSSYEQYLAAKVRRTKSLNSSRRDSVRYTLVRTLHHAVG